MANESAQFGIDGEKRVPVSHTALRGTHFSLVDGVNKPGQALSPVFYPKAIFGGDSIFASNAEFTNSRDYALFTVLVATVADACAAPCIW